MIQFIKHAQEVSYVPRDAVKRSNEHNVKTVRSSIGQKLVESWASRFCTGKLCRCTPARFRIRAVWPFRAGRKAVLCLTTRNRTWISGYGYQS